jgi:hypothetical protein
VDMFSFSTKFGHGYDGSWGHDDKGHHTKTRVKMLVCLVPHAERHSEFSRSQFLIRLFRHSLTERYVEVLKINLSFPLVVPLGA